MRIGEQVEHFRILRLLGEGGMGRVYLARDFRLGRKVAIKIIRFHAGSHSEDFIRKFVAEARTTARFNHPNIVTLYEVGEYKGHPYFAMEYVRGESLHQRSKHRRLGHQEIIRIATAIASALTEAHAHGVLHLDLKPRNIVIPKDGRLRVLDFGLARKDRAEPSSQDNSLDRPGLLVGTPTYMAPEQWDGKPPTEATDVWALGIILYELVAGQRPYQKHEEDPDTFTENVTSEAPVPQLPPNERISGIVARCLQKGPDQRPAASQVLNDLQNLLDGRSEKTQSNIRNPFRGLRPFTKDHATHFFGRQREIDEMVERLESESILPVVGASGSGKSSLVQAGVIPRLMEQGDWTVFSFRPGLDPFKSLATCLLAKDLSVTGNPARSASGRAESLIANFFVFPDSLALYLEQVATESQNKVLVVVDQLEELYTLCHDPDRQNRFIRALVSAADDGLDPVRVVFTIRDDFLLRLATAGPEVRAASRRMMMLQPPDRDALVEILTRPVEMHGYTYENSSIVDDMIDAVEAKASSLPLLQFAAFMLWEQRDQEQKSLTEAAYRDLGGVAGVLAHHADSVLETSLQVDVVRDILLRLITPEGTRRIVPQDQVLEGLGPGAESVLDALISTRLVTTVRLHTPTGSQSAIELAHESLIHTWNRLGAWIDAQKDELRFLNEAREAAELWARRGRLSDEVWTRNALEEGQRLLENCASPVPKVVREFIESGQAFERRQKIRQRGFLLGAFLALVMISSVAVRGWIVSDKSATSARNASRFASATVHRNDPTLVLALLREMEPTGALPKAWRELARWATFQTIAKIVLSHPTKVNSAAFSPNDAYIATGSQDGLVRIYDAQGLDPPRILRGHEAPVNSVAFSPDGNRLVTTSKDLTIRIWHLDDSAAPTIFRGHTDNILSASFSSDGTRIVSAAWDESARVWNVDGSGEPLVFSATATLLYSVAFSPDDTHIAFGAWDGTIAVQKLDETGPPLILRGHDGAVHSVSFSPDGQQIVSGARDETIRLWNADGSGTPRIFRGHDEDILSVRFSPDGRQILSASVDKTVRVWPIDHSEAQESLVLRGHRGGVLSASFDTTGQRILTASQDKTVRIWYPNEFNTPTLLRGHDDLINSAEFSPDGKSIVTAADDGKVYVWPSDGSTAPTTVLAIRDNVNAASFSSDGRRIVTSSNDKKTRVLSLDGPADPIVHQHPVVAASAAFSPDGTQILAGVWNGTVELWNIDGTAPALILDESTEGVNSVAFSPNGDLIAGSGQELKIWNRKGSEPPLVLRGHRHIIYSSAFSPDGSRVITGSYDGTARVWQLDGKTPDGNVPYVELRGHTDKVYTGSRGGIGAFSPDGKRVLTISHDETLRIWNTDGSGEPAVLQIPRSRGYSIAFSPDGSQFVTASHSRRNPITGRVEHWATVWPSFERFTGLDDPALWKPTRYCPPLELRIEFLGLSRREAKKQLDRCKTRVAGHHGRTETTIAR